MQILRQLGELFLEAVPTILIVLLFYWFLRANFFQPLQKTLAERNARIHKAKADAEVIQAAAKETTRSYEEALRKARASVFAEQEKLRQAALEERAALLRRARSAAQEIVSREKQRIEGELNAARTQLEGQSENIASRIAQMILAGPRRPREEAR
jgi:F0F1-type ATP synthase membrane subunit b/b'